MATESNLEFSGKVNYQRLTSLDEDFKKEQAEILVDRARFAKYGTNSNRKAALMAGEYQEELTRERFPEES